MKGRKLECSVLVQEARWYRPWCGRAVIKNGYQENRPHSKMYNMFLTILKYVCFFLSPQLVGYNKPATLQVFIGTDVGRVAPHMFYQACRVSGKNSTPCTERKIDGTIVIEVDFDPAKDMIIT